MKKIGINEKNAKKNKKKQNMKLGMTGKRK